MWKFLRQDQKNFVGMSERCHGQRLVSDRNRVKSTWENRDFCRRAGWSLEDIHVRYDAEITQLADADMGENTKGARLLPRPEKSSF